MSEQINQSNQAPGVNLTGVQERKLLEAELLACGGQLRNYEPIRDRVASGGGDPTAIYHQVASRRDDVLAQLKRLGPWPSEPSQKDPRVPRPRFEQPLSAIPIAPAIFDPNLGRFGFGSSGWVQVANAGEGVNVVPQGQFPISGEIFTTGLVPAGEVTFDAVLQVGPERIDPKQVDPTIKYFWLRNWKYLIPFPTPALRSMFTYRFDVSVLTSIFFSGLGATAMAFVSLGETANLVPGSDIVVNIDAGFPLVADLSQPTASYNGTYGFVHGESTVERSFLVSAGHVPGVAIVIGIVAGLSMMTTLRYDFPSEPDSGITIGSENVTGRVAFHYEPQPVAQS